MDEIPLKRRMLKNPSTGSHRGHPQPHPSQLTPFNRAQGASSSNTDAQIQSQLNQAVSQLTDSADNKLPAKPHAAKTVTSITKPPPPKPLKPVVLPPQDNAPKDTPQYTSTIKSEVAQQIKEAPITRPQGVDETELDQVKKLPLFRPVVIGTILFIAGLIVSAIIAITFNLI